VIGRNKIFLSVSIILFIGNSIFGQSIVNQGAGASEKVESMFNSVIAYNDFAVVKENETVRINILNNDIGLNDGVSALTIETQPINGSVQVNEDNTIQYTSEPGFWGTDQFTYKVCNLVGDCDEARVDVQIDDVDYTPVAVNDTVVLIHGSDQVIRILDNDTIKGDFPYVINIVQGFNHGDAHLDDDNVLIPFFPRNFGGADSLQYSICDVDNDCDNAWVFVDVQFDGKTDFFIPNGFSPNNDGYNDTFYIPDFNSFTNIKVTIFNEWGQIVYSNSNYQNNWNGVANSGALNGKPVQSGTYYYQFAIPGITQIITGSIYLSR